MKKRETSAAGEAEKRGAAPKNAGKADPASKECESATQGGKQRGSSTPIRNEKPEG